MLIKDETIIRYETDWIRELIPEHKKYLKMW